MLRLLLEKERKYIKREYRMRFLNVLFAILIGMIVIWIATLIPSYLLISVENKVYDAKVKNLEDSELSKEREDLGLQTDSLNNKIELLEKKDYSYFELIKVIRESANGGVSLESIDFSHDENGKLLIFVKGIALDRDNLSDFSKKLEEYQYFERAEFPFSDFAKGTEIPFSITIDVLPI